MRPSTAYSPIPARNAHFSPRRAKFQNSRNTPAIKRFTTRLSAEPVVPDSRPMASTISVMPRPKMKWKFVPLIVSTEFTMESSAMARNHPAPFFTICSARSFCSTDAVGLPLGVPNPPVAMRDYLMWEWATALSRADTITGTILRQTETTSAIDSLGPFRVTLLE